MNSITRAIATADLVGNVYVTASLLSISSSNPGSLPTGRTTRMSARWRVDPFWALMMMMSFICSCRDKI
jgi:hypothetical protein